MYLAALTAFITLPVSIGSNAVYYRAIATFAEMAQNASSVACALFASPRTRAQHTAQQREYMCDFACLLYIRPAVVSIHDASANAGHITAIAQSEQHYQYTSHFVYACTMVCTHV